MLRARMGIRAHPTPTSGKTSKYFQNYWALGEAIPSKPLSLACAIPRGLASEGGEEGRASAPLVDLREPAPAPKAQGRGGAGCNGETGARSGGQ